VTEGRDDPVARLRAAFDRGFAARPAERRRDLVALLAVRAGGEPVALRVLETGGLLHAPTIVPVPGARPELLGIAGLRGEILPVFALARLLGRATAAEARWIALAGGGAARVGLAFEAFEGHVVVPSARVRPAPGGGTAFEIAELDGGARPVLSMGELLRAVAR
jgi:purine-binding chemotaxis protein CheW